MFPTTRIRVFLVVLAAALTVALHAESPPALPLFGVWKMNPSKSSVDPGPVPYKKSTCKIEPWEDGLKVTYDMVGTRGGVTHLEWTGKLDGRDYPIEGVDDVITNAYTRIDDRTYDVTVKVDGGKAASARIAIAPDGSTLTTVTSSRNALGQTLKSTTVYDRQ
jgi:hypothetical protein